MKNKLKNVLIVDDEKPFLLSLTDGLKLYSRKFNVITADSGTAAVSIIGNMKIDLMVTDLRMQGMDGFALLRYLRKENYDFPVIVITAHDTTEIIGKLMEMGISDLMEKPLDFTLLAGKILERLPVDEVKEQEKQTFLGFLSTFVGRRGIKKKMAVSR